MSSAATNLRSMSTWGKGALLVGLFFGGCWAGAIIFWRTTDRMPTAGELTLCLVGVPLLLCGGLWLSRRMIDTGSLAPDKAADVNAGTSVRAKGQPIAILAGALRLPHGSTPEEVCAATRANKAHPDLDPELRDEDGFPVMTARCAAADDVALQDEIVDWFSANGNAAITFADAQVRALALASHVATELANAAPELMSKPLRIIPIAPRDWTADQVRAASAWLLGVVGRCGWPAQQCTFDPALSIDGDGARIIEGVRPNEFHALSMVLAFESNISDQIIRRWDDEQRLFTAANQSGLIPGEGAAGVLIATSPVLTTIAGGTLATLVSFEVGRRTAGADDGKRPDASLLIDLMKKAVAAAGEAGASREIEVIAADTGHRANRTLELLGTVNEITPHLDETEDVLRLGGGTGSCGAVQSLAALIVAGFLAIERRSCAIWISNEDAHHRSVAIIAAKEQPRSA
jgi:hypothetical protein